MTQTTERVTIAEIGLFTFGQWTWEEFTLKCYESCVAWHATIYNYHLKPEYGALCTIKNLSCIIYTGGGQKLRTGSLVLPVADNILSECIWLLFCLLLGLL